MKQNQFSLAAFPFLLF